jgi:crotonobetainyl-CoA:carnitine CoA-transferase CaiB-like acyl-CoA transferase
VAGPLEGVRVLDLSRILAGPWTAQTLADLGAEVVKVERPGVGDDTRSWGPPWLADGEGRPTGESAYFLSANRGKRSITVEFAKPEGQEVVRRLAAASDILIENYKAGGLARFGLDYEGLRAANPRLIYCSITGFGQTGPYAPRPGYDALVQAMGGIMSLTGAPDGPPQKVGVPIADLFAGLYGCIGLLAALNHRNATGEGQRIDIGMLDTHVAWLANQGMNYLATGENPPRLGNQHPNIAPYQEFPSKDGYIILAVGNDPTFERFCKNFGQEHLLADERFATNAKRVENRDLVTGTLTPVMRSKTTADWIEALEALKIGCGPINTLSQVFADPQVQARGCVVEMPHASGQTVKVVANPVRLSATPPAYTSAPPTLGQHTAEVLGGLLGMGEAEIAALKEKNVA